MIFINKANEPIPRILVNEGVTKRNEHINDFLANQAEYRLSRKKSKKFNFDKGIYADSTVRTELERIQKNKCCFCESKFKHVSSGDVEHFRPKAEYSQGHGNQLCRPGYFWLAYDWDNLLVSCEVCNRREKGSYFPLKNPIRRFIDHNSNIHLEEPWFINPSLIDPEMHITFHNEIPKHITFEGAKTIEYLSLDREELNEIRYEKLNFLKSLEETYLDVIGSEYENTVRERFFRHLREIIYQNGEFKSMVKANFRNYLPLI
jgi:uncharacterized protein (TIGR02646 family)